MKKFFGLLLLVCSVAMAKSAPVTNNDAGARILFDPSDRVQIFEYTRNSISGDGQILVCPMNMEATWRDVGVCLDANKKNAWHLLDNSAPAGYKVVAYEFRFIGSGYRTLIVYYSKK